MPGKTTDLSPEQSRFRVYSYRWIVLSAFMFIVLVNQILWITYAPVTGDAARFYGVSDLGIGLLSMSFMVVYILVSIPASWIIDQFGIRVSLGTGALLTGIFGLLRGLFSRDYTLVLIFQVGIAFGQPFILNAITKVAARWFPIEERATASGLATLSMYAGILLGLILTPYLTLACGLKNTVLIYGLASLLAPVVFFALIRERPVTPPCPPGQEERMMAFRGLGQMIRQKDFWWLLFIFFIGLGVFNCVTTWIEDIVRPRGFLPYQAGIIGGVMILGGVIGALVLPPLSDKRRKRVPFIVIALAGATVGLTGITFAMTYWLLLCSSFIMGFFLLSAGPIGFQYGAEMTFPAPEGTSNGLLLLVGQISGIAFIIGMDVFKSAGTGSMTLPLTGLIVLMILSLILCLNLKESDMLKRDT